MEVWEPTYLGLRRLQQLFQEAKDYHGQYSRNWDKNLLAYRGIDPDRRAQLDYDGYATTRIKYAFQVLEVIRVNVVEPNPTFDMVPLSQGRIETANALQHVIPYQLKRDRFGSKQNTWVEDDFVCGVHVAKLAWRHQVVHRGGTPVVLFNQPTAIPVDPRTWFPDPHVADQSEWAYGFHEAHLSRDQVVYMIEQGVYDQAEGFKLLAGGPDRDVENNRELGFRVVEYWTHEVCQTFCDKGVLANRPNDHLSGQIPFIMGSTIPRSRCVFGIPEVDLMFDSQHLLWSLDNMGIEALKYAARPVVGYRRDRVSAAEVRANMRPGGAIPFATPQDLNLFYQGGAAEQIFRRKAEALADAQNVTGASSYLAGADSQQYGVNQNTATGIGILEAGASKRMKHRMANLEEFYSGIVKGFIKLDAQFLPAPLEMMIRSGDEYAPLQLSREEIAGEYEVIPRWLSESTNEEAEMQSLMALFNTLSPLALQGYHFPDGSVINLRPLVERIISRRRWPVAQFITPADQAKPVPEMPAPSPLPGMNFGPTVNGMAPQQPPMMATA